MFNQDQQNPSPLPNSTATQTVVASGSGGGGGKKAIIGVVVLTITVLGVVAGLFLNQQSQDIRSGASGDCSGIQNPSVTGEITIPSGCTVSGVRFSGDAPSGASSNGDCVGFSENGQQVSFTGPTTIDPNPSCGKCEQVDLSTGHGVAKYGGACGSGGGDQKTCGGTCNTDADCKNPSPAGVTVWCNPTNKICESKFCPTGQTQPGANCQCNAGRTCGQSCGASVGLCNDGVSECGFITNPNQCLGAEGNTSKQFCLPKNPGQGYTVARCSGIAANYLKGPNGETGTPPLTQQDVIDACNPAVASPTPSPSPIVSAQCLNIQAFDTNWAPLTNAQLTQLNPGDTIRFTVAGSATGGIFDKARFTVNGSLRPEVTDKRPSTEEFFDEYTIPAGATGLSVSAEIHHSTLEWF